MAVLFPKAREYWHTIRDFFRIGLPLRVRRMRYGPMFGLRVTPTPRSAAQTTAGWIDGYKAKAFQERPKISYDGESSIYRRDALPVTVMPELWAGFERHREFEIPKVFVVTLPGGRTAGHFGTIITPDNIVLSDVSRHATVQYPQVPFDPDAEIPPATWSRGPIAVVACANHSYYHWMFDMLPRLEILRRLGFGMELLEGVVINRPKYKPQYETLDMLQFPAEKRIFTTRKLHIGSARLLVPSYADSPFQCPPWVCSFLRDTFLPHASSRAFPKRIYISRRNAPSRRLENEPELVAIAKESGFEEVGLEDMAFSDQVALFSQAEMIIGVHGAAFTSTVFSKPGTKVMEILPRQRMNHLFWGLASVLKIGYHYVVADETSERSETNFDPDITLSATVWKEAMAAFLK